MEGWRWEIDSTLQVAASAIMRPLCNFALYSYMAGFLITLDLRSAYPL